MGRNTKPRHSEQSEGSIFAE